MFALAMALQENQRHLARPARSLMAKFVAASPVALRERLRAAAANAAQPEIIDDFDAVVGIVDDAIRDERKLRIVYVDQTGETSRRTIKPLAWAESNSGESVAAWCELRRDFRHFRIDRVEAIVALQAYFKGEREALLNGYLAQEGGGRSRR